MSTDIKLEIAANLPQSLPLYLTELLPNFRYIDLGDRDCCSPAHIMKRRNLRLPRGIKGKKKNEFKAHSCCH
jgi:hypothetical protein